MVALVERGGSHQVPFPETGKPDRRQIGALRSPVRARGRRRPAGEHVEHTGLSVLGGLASQRWVPGVAGVIKVLRETQRRGPSSQLGVTRWQRIEEGQPGKKEGHWALRGPGHREQAASMRRWGRSHGSGLRSQGENQRLRMYRHSCKYSHKGEKKESCHRKGCEVKREIFWFGFCLMVYFLIGLISSNREQFWLS